MATALERLALVIGTALLLAGCATSPPQPEAMRDPNARWDAYATYAVGPAPGAAGADRPLELLDQNLRFAISNEMVRRGYTESAEPDLRVIYQTAAKDVVESNPVRVGVGMGSWGGNFGGSVNVGSPSVRSYREGTLVISVIDTDRNAEVWQGRVSNRVGKGGTGSTAATSAVQAAMRDFPARAPGAGESK